MRTKSTSTTAPSTATSSGCVRSSARSTRISMPSKPFTASATATANRNSVGPEAAERPAAPERVHSRGRRPWRSGSRLGRLIVVLNLLGLAVLVGGSLVLNELRQGLINAQMASLSVEGDLIANVIDQTATVGDPQPALEADRAADVIESLFIPRSQRLRLFDA